MKKLFAAVVASAITFAASAQKPEQIGDWANGRSAAGKLFALTTNDSGGVIGQWCDVDANQSCYWVMATRSECQQDDQYPALLNNSTTGAAHITLICDGTVQLSGATHHRLLISPFDAVDRAVRAGTKLSIAFPMKDDGFRVSRFSLDGAAATMERFDRVKLFYDTLHKKNSTKDVNL